MMYKAMVAVCSEIRTKHSTQSEHHVEFWNVWAWWYIEKPLGFKRLTASQEYSSVLACRHTKSYMFYIISTATYRYFHKTG
jgi:hypothetical protein